MGQTEDFQAVPELGKAFQANCTALAGHTLQNWLQNSQTAVLLHFFFKYIYYMYFFLKHIYLPTAKSSRTERLDLCDPTTLTSSISFEGGRAQLQLYIPHPSHT